MSSQNDTFVPTPLTVDELDARLSVATTRRVAENARVRAETHSLQMLVSRKQHLAARLEATLAELQSEQETIDTEIRRLLTPEEQTRFAELTTH